MAAKRKPSAPSPTFAMETITPARAEEYLRANIGNRRISRRTVVRYAGDMKRGEWVWNGEAIKFDMHGRLIDGQHRLLAIIESGVAILIGVFRGLPPETFQTIDVGKNRTPADILSAKGFSYPTELGNAMRLLYSYGTERWSAAGQTRMTNTQLVQLLEAHPNLIERASEAMVKPFRCRLITGGANIFGYYCASMIDFERAQRFFRELAGGRFHERGSDAIHTLRERLIQVSQETLTTPPRVKLCWLITAWNHFYARSRLSRLSRLPGAVARFTPEPFA